MPLFSSNTAIFRARLMYEGGNFSANSILLSNLTEKLDSVKLRDDCARRFAPGGST